MTPILRERKALNGLARLPNNQILSLIKKDNFLIYDKTVRRFPQQLRMRRPPNVPGPLPHPILVPFHCFFANLSIFG
jgi:hypothetical protein